MNLKSCLRHFTAAAALIIAFGSAQSALATEKDQKTSSFQAFSLVGSWNCLGTGNGGLGGLPFLITFHEENTYNVALPRKSQSETHGTWKRTGRNTFKSSDLSIGYDANGIANALQTVTATEEVTSNTTMNVNVSGVVRGLASGTVFVQFNGILNCKLIPSS